MLTKSSAKMTIANEIFARRAKKVLIETAEGESLPPQYVASVLMNLESLGYGLSAELTEDCGRMTLEKLTDFHNGLMESLGKGKGAHKRFEPMYPNFPQQVMDMSKARLYLNAFMHYLTDGRWSPKTEKKERSPLADETEIKIIERGSQEEFECLFRQLALANTSLSAEDKHDLRLFVELYGNDVLRLMPDEVPNRENKAFLVAALISSTVDGSGHLSRFCTTATDVLRVAVAMSDGDVSLAEPVKFRSYSRRERRALLQVLESQSNPTEDMLRWKARWIRLGERLHPSEYKKRFPRCDEAFDVLRNNRAVPRFNSTLEKALEDKNLDTLLTMLATRPGDFARRLDHILRLEARSQNEVAAAFSTVAMKVSTPVLLQVMHHFKTRAEPRALRVFFPKGEVAKAQGILNTLPKLPPELCRTVFEICESTLISRFSKLPDLGTCYVDPVLKNYMVPFSQRSASKALRTVTRGSRLPLLTTTDTLRFFIWWKNGLGRADIDLSAAVFDTKFRYLDVLSYYNLKNFGGHHSGDIVDAPNGASEFIDISISKSKQLGARYVVMVLNSYTGQPYCDLPECFAGWMSRKQADSGEIYEPRTVSNKFDIASNTKVAIPAIFDLVEREVIWADMGLNHNPGWFNNVAGNLTGIQLTVQSLVDIAKPNLYDLLQLHVQARGQEVQNPNDAVTVFSEENETPFHPERIASEFMQN